MEDLVDRGLVRSIGVSNFSPEKIQEILQNARITPAVNQVLSTLLCPKYRKKREVYAIRRGSMRGSMVGPWITGGIPLSSG